jgi:hypothetical protein
VSHIETVKTGVCTDECCAPPVVFPTRPGQSGDRQALIREAFRLEWLPIGWTTANRLLLAAIAALALAGAALAQETIATSLRASKGLAASHPFAGIKKRRATLRSGSEHWWGPTRPRDALSPTTVSLASRKR